MNPSTTDGPFSQAEIAFAEEAFDWEAASLPQASRTALIEPSVHDVRSSLIDEQLHTFVENSLPENWSQARSTDFLHLIADTWAYQGCVLEDGHPLFTHSDSSLSGVGHPEWSANILLHHEARLLPTAPHPSPSNMDFSVQPVPPPPYSPSDHCARASGPIDLCPRPDVSPSTNGVPSWNSHYARPSHAYPGEAVTTCSIQQPKLRDPVTLRRSSRIRTAPVYQAQHKHALDPVDVDVKSHHIVSENDSSDSEYDGSDGGIPDTKYQPKLGDSGVTSGRSRPKDSKRSETRYRCPVKGCLKTFSRGKDAQRHVENVHDTRSEEEIRAEQDDALRKSCRWCGKILARVDSRKRHETKSCKYNPVAMARKKRSKASNKPVKGFKRKGTGRPPKR